MENLCINCRKNPIYIQKRGLCQGCSSKYYTERYRQKKDRKIKSEVRHGAEVEFIKNFFVSGKNWIYLPAKFKLNGTTYEPDFYDGERNVFIEVSGTRQAFHYNKHKYRQFAKTYPLIAFEVRQASGDLIDITQDKFHINNKK